MNSYILLIITIFLMMICTFLLDALKCHNKKQNKFTFKLIINVLTVFIILFVSFLLYKCPLDFENIYIDKSLKYIKFLSICSLMFISLLVFFIKYFYEELSFNKYLKIVIFSLTLLFLYYVNFYFIYKVAFIVNIVVSISYFRFLILYLKRQDCDGIGFEFVNALAILFLIIYFLGYTFFKII